MGWFDSGHTEPRGEMIEIEKVSAYKQHIWGAKPDPKPDTKTITGMPSGQAPALALNLMKQIWQNEKKIVEVTIEEAQEIINAYYKLHPKILQVAKRAEQHARKHGLFGNIFSQAAGGSPPPPDKPPQRGPMKRDPHRDDRPKEDKGKAKEHYEKEQGKTEGNGGEQKDGKLW